MDIKLTKEMVIDHLGQPNKKENNELIWQCPICQDKSADNMKYNTVKNVLYCFANEQHSKIILSEIYKKNKPQPIHTPDTKQWQINTDEYTLYQDECNRALMANDNALNYLYEHRMINPFTVEKCGIGYDNEDKNRAKWVFPIIDITMKIKGFRYRGWDLTNKTIWSETDTPNCLAYIYGRQINENLYICEGEWDACIMVQILEKYDKLENSTVITPSMGVGNLEKCIDELVFGNFKKIHLCLDNDIEKRKIIKNGKSQDVSLQVTKRLIELYPFMIDKTPQFTDKELKAGNKDLSDWYELHRKD